LQQKENRVKINDRITLGIVSGFTANMAKMAIMNFARSKNWSEITGMEKSAGMLLPAHQVYSKKGKLVGLAADNAVSMLLGIATVYMLSVAGKDKAWLKGLTCGEGMWAGVYGVLATMGATRVDPLTPKTVLSELVGHSAFGITAAMTAAYLGDPSLFSGGKPLLASPLGARDHNRQVEALRTHRRSRRGDKRLSTAATAVN
jgi:hypothetical protein